MAATSMDTLISLAKRRGFIYPGSELYGGLANSWDYGPLGVELKNNIKKEWWSRFVHRRPDVVGIDAALLMNPKVWEASGHLETFSDPLIECKVCHHRFRADQLDGVQVIEKPKNSNDRGHSLQFAAHASCPDCGSRAEEAFGESELKNFNLMLKTFLGPSEEQASAVYFRPETAQAMFVDFKQVVTTTRLRVPFGIAQIGKAFRNEITPGNFIFRMREFEQMEIEYFIREAEWEKYFDHWLDQMKGWLTRLGVANDHLHFVEIPDGERAHYSKRTVDIEYDYPFGQKELYGLAYRTDFDLQNHMRASGQDLSYTNPEDPTDKFVPHVIEPTWGVDRSALVAMLEAYREEEAPTAVEGETDKRVVMKFPYWLAPVKIAVLPLFKKPELQTPAGEIFDELSERFVCEYDETQSIGKRYRRQDEIGTPFCVTIDYDTANDKKVTVRERDTMVQDRVAIAELVPYLTQKLNV